MTIRERINLAVDQWSDEAKWKQAVYDAWLKGDLKPVDEIGARL